MYMYIRGDSIVKQNLIVHNVLIICEHVSSRSWIMRNKTWRYLEKGRFDPNKALSLEMKETLTILASTTKENGTYLHGLLCI